jgi:MSHA biogenesis protein MshJ
MKKLTLPRTDRFALPALSALSARWEAMSRRERLLVTAGCAAVSLLLVDHLWISPSWRDWSQARQTRQQTLVAVQTLSADARTLQERQALDAQQLRAELTALQARIAASEAQGLAHDLVTPAQMLPLLEHLLSRHHGLTVRSLQSLGQTPFGEGSPAIYRHGVELTVEGRYADLLDYLRALEASPQRLLWGSLQLKVVQHPQVLLTLRLHTLSTDARWVEI